ncbi:MAG: PTS sugar transporter subunit IIC, partial [Clostridia bacterium]|nr:PTS sugar transporter subunit IIC [Clostridia bacterium]
MPTKGNTNPLYLYNRLSKINEQRHIRSIRIAFVSTMPIIIIGAYAVVLNQLPVPAYQQFMENIFGDQWRVFGGLAFNATTQVVTLVVVFSICSNLADWYNSNQSKQVHGGICGIVGLASYLVISLPLLEVDSLPFNIAGVNGLFIAIIVSITVGEAMVRLSNRRTRLQLLSDDPNMVVPQSFASVVPAMLIVGGFLIFRVFLIRMGIVEGLPHHVNDLLSKPFVGGRNSIGTAVLYSIFSHLMWLFGIHGNNVLDGVAQTVFVPAGQVNAAMAAAGFAPPNMITKTFFDVFVYMGGSGTTLALLISLFIFGRKRGQQSLFKFALPNSIFNINEPLIFGIPIVLNPYYALPFIFTPVL